MQIFVVRRSLESDPTKVFATHSMGQQNTVLDAYPADEYDVFSTATPVSPADDVPDGAVAIRVGA